MNACCSPGLCLNLQPLCAGGMYRLPSSLQEVHVGCVTVSQVTELIRWVAYVTLTTVQVAPDDPRIRVAKFSPLKWLEVRQVRPKGRHIGLDLTGHHGLGGRVSVKVPAEIEVVYGPAESEPESESG